MASTSAPAPIDPRGPRTNQTVLATALVLGLVFQQQWVAPLFAVVLFLGAAFGPKYGPVLRFYAAVIKPRLGPPSELEDPRPPRFAASVGVLFLAAASWRSSSAPTPRVGPGRHRRRPGRHLGRDRPLRRLRDVRLAGAPARWCPGREDRPVLGEGDPIESSRAPPTTHTGRTPRAAPLPVDLRSGGAQWVVFSTEYCAVCPSVVAEIESHRPGEAVTVLDVAEHLDLASQYKVRRAPTVLRVDADGSVVARLSGVDAVRAELGALPAGA